MGRCAALLCPMLMAVLLLDAPSRLGALPAAGTVRRDLASLLSLVRSRATGLYRSYTPRTATWLPVAPAGHPAVWVRTAQGYLDDAAFLYDNALVVMALQELGDLASARNLLLRYAENFPLRKNSALYGLYNCHNADSFDPFLRLPDGTARYLSMGLDGDRIHLGPNVFMALAALRQYALAGDREALAFACRMHSWIRTFAFYKDERGVPLAPAMGFGWGAPWQRVFSTENVLDYYAFLQNLLLVLDKDGVKVAALHAAAGITAAELRGGIAALERWFRTVAWNRRGSFNRGCFGPLPSGGYRIDTIEALDTNTWAVSAIGPGRLSRLGIDPVRLLAYCEKRLLVRIRAGGDAYEGFDFTDHAGYHERRKAPVIWWEGTAQYVQACRLISGHPLYRGAAAALALGRRGTSLLEGMYRFSTRVMRASLGELSYTSYPVGPQEDIYAFNDWWPLARGKAGHPYLTSISSTLWRFFAHMDINPFRLPGYPDPGF